MDCKTAGIADIGHVIVQLQSIDEFTSGFLAANKFESDQPAKLVAQISVCTLAIDTLLLRRMNNPLHLFSLEQKIDHRLRIFAVLLHPQSKRLKTLDDEKSIEWRHRGPDVPQERDPGLDRVGHRPSGLTASVQIAPW